MSTTTNESNVPAGFTVRDWLAYNEGVDVDGTGFAEKQTWGVHDGPSSGNVHSSWAADRGFVLEVEACGIDNLLVGDLTPRQARTLASRLLEVADQIEELQTEGVRDATRAIVSRKRATVTDVARAADALGVRASTLLAACEAERAVGEGEG